ncbi:circadian clock KaiB family protein [Thermocoleostomius sinensis]|uniref:Circadian clock KaiB family protein n=1 Tax=Thermocoleostomius sinensis A174 TaxID=2016057 RepID=A0A9E8ZJG4_9CYAN|nr:circadian clock KaiB family protein [Thermocoleostomius sinensis]WAL62363.1 circadian clock KaiB family protein [Thermocoleostomius sinensis A174]
MTADSNFTPHTLDLFKGIALFTPGGDLVYCIDPQKQSRWHLQLCAVLQEMLGLSEPPHFLVPCYTATIDRWFNPRTQQLQTFAEACPSVLRYQPLLNAIFGVEDLDWQAVTYPEGVCDPRVLNSYRNQFPQLWQDHDLVIRYEKNETRSLSTAQGNSVLSWSPSRQDDEAEGYVLRLFVAGNNPATAHILKNLYELLERSLQRPYTLKVIDIHKHPELAELNQVTATPTLVKVWPRPVRRIIGNLDDFTTIARVLQPSPTNYRQRN